MRQQLARTGETVCSTADIRWSYRWSTSLKNRTAQNGFLGTTDLLLVGMHRNRNSNVGDRTGSGAHDTSSTCSRFGATSSSAFSNPPFLFWKADVRSSAALLKVTRQQGAKHHICSGLTGVHFFKTPWIMPFQFVRSKPWIGINGTAVLAFGGNQLSVWFMAKFVTVYPPWQPPAVGPNVLWICCRVFMTNLVLNGLTDAYHHGFCEYSLQIKCSESLRPFL